MLKFYAEVAEVLKFFAEVAEVLKFCAEVLKSAEVLKFY